MKITSVNNELVKDTAKLLQKKYRNQSNLFLLEGFKVIKEAYDNDLDIKYVFVNSSNISEYKFLPSNCIYEVNDAILKKISSTDTPPEAVAVAKQVEYKISNLKTSKKVILLEDIKDAGNLGTIVRSAVAFGADAIVLFGENTVDIFNPKCVRATVGNLWKIPIYNIKDITELKLYFSDFTRIATLPRTNNLLKSYKPKLPILLMFGSEAYGLSQTLIEYSNDSVKIEMKESVESLNLATSVSILSYVLFNN